ncbi:MAG: hypothetical protein AAF762_03435, partial [Pseudomonadota bacterium]
ILWIILIFIPSFVPFFQHISYFRVFPRRLPIVNRNSVSTLSRGEPLLKAEDMEVSGQYLMHYGLVLPWSFPQTMWVLEGERL